MSEELKNNHQFLDEDEGFVMEHDDDDYDMEYDDEGYDMETGDEDFDDSDDGDDDDIEEVLEGLSELDRVAYLVKLHQEQEGLPAPILRQVIFEESLRSLAQEYQAVFDDLILSFDQGDTVYIGLLTELYPSLSNHLNKAQSTNRPLLIQLLAKALARVRGEEESEVQEPTKPQAQPENVVKEVPDKLRYIQQLAEKGFRVIGNQTPIAGKTGVHDTMLGILKLFYKATPLKGLGYKDRVYMVNEGVLTSVGLNPRNVDIWNPDVYSRDEDLMFRLFVREDAISFTILMKLPSGMNNFDFGSKRSEDLQAIPLLFSNMDSSKGEVFSSSLIKNPRVCNLGNTRNVSCAYDCVEIVLSKDLMAFKKSDWLLRDYIKANKGIRTPFSQFDELALGEKIAIGVMPGSLKLERFDCTGKFNVSGIIGGGAGSGKTAMYDNIMVQALALKGYEGNGATILIDPKQEWVMVWKRIFDSMGVPFYGFDGAVLDKSDIKWVNPRGDGEPEEIPFTVHAYYGGIIFIRVIYETIQKVLNAVGATDVLDFNKGGYEYKGITRLPRTFILVDELNTIYANIASGSDKALPKDLYKGLILARLTRTSGYNWFLGGQDPSKTVIQSDERSNYGYNIFGKMAEERYTYFGVTPNQAVLDYESRNATVDNPNPIMSQGMFYAGPQGKTDLVKCLFLPKEERKEALLDLETDFAGMFELDKLVKLALTEGYFDTLQTTLKFKNNIVYAALKYLGHISQQEFEMYSERCLTGRIEEEGSDFEGVLTPDFGVPQKQAPTSKDSEDEVIEVSSASTVSVERQSKGSRGIENTVETSEDSGHVQANKGEGTTKQSTVGISSPNSARQGVRESDVKPEADVTDASTYVSPSKQNGFTQIYRQTMDLPTNPFKVWKKADSIVGSMNALKMMSKYLMDEIGRAFYSYDRIESVEIANNGLIINNVAFRPAFREDLIESLPYDIRERVASGDVTELFHFENLKRFKNLQILRIDNPQLAEGRVRRELHIHPRKPWSELFKKFKSLRVLNIGGEQITDEVTAKEYDEKGRGGYTLTEKLAQAFKMTPSVVTGSRVQQLWNSRPVRIATRAVGWTLGVKAITVAASLFGPWGLLMGAFAGYGAIREYQKRK